MAAKLDPGDLRFVYPLTNPSTYSLFYVFSLLPSSVQKRIIGIYNALK
jgi:hypothetical protein